MSPSSSNTSRQRASKFIEHIRDDMQDKIDEGLHRVEKMEREKMVERMMDHWKRENPKQCKKLNWEASYKSNNNLEYHEENANDIQNIDQSVHVRWHENTISGTKYTGRKGERPISPVRKTRKVKVAKSLATAKKVLCFGSTAPDP